MDFIGWLNESNLNDLYNSTVDAFPQTTLRQHAVQPIKITQLSIIPFKGMKTIYFKGLAQNEGRRYNTVILFKNVDYDSPNSISIVADDGNTYRLSKLSPVNEVNLRCDCGDFRWRWNFTDWEDGSLYGKKRRKYESLGIGPPANPKEMPGMCKHLIALTTSLRDSGILLP